MISDIIEKRAFDTPYKNFLEHKLTTLDLDFDFLDLDFFNSSMACFFDFSERLNGWIIFSI